MHHAGTREPTIRKRAKTRPRNGAFRCRERSLVSIGRNWEVIRNCGKRWTEMGGPDVIRRGCEAIRGRFSIF